MSDESFFYLFKKIWQSQLKGTSKCQRIPRERFRKYTKSTEHNHTRTVFYWAEQRSAKTETET